jgi:uncharacterized protein involved in exopolysaccharide biosynthesis
MDATLDPRQLLRSLWRRKWWFAGPATFVAGLAVLVILFVPPIYRSEATILIERQNIPEDLVPSLLDDYVDRRIDMLTRRVLTADTLLEIADLVGIYPTERETLSRAALADRMRNDITIERLSTEIRDPRSRRTGEITVAFQVRFDYQRPRAAKQVVDELVSRYLSVNLETRRRIAEQTRTFFATERGRVETRIAEIEDELAAFRADNRELLPEEVAFKRRQLARVEQRLQNLQSNLQSLREQEGYLTTQLGLTEEFDTPDGRVGSPETQLEVLLAELASARARYTPDHPDVRRLEREVRSMRAVVGARFDTGRAGEMAERERRLVAELARLRERYTGDHPDVVRASRELRSVRSAMAEAAADAPAAGGGRERNDAHVRLSAQLNSIRSEIGAIEEQRRELEDDRLALERALAAAPEVEADYTRLRRALDTALEQRDLLAEKETSAELSGSLETTGASERFILAEPATLPRSPVHPNEKLILAIGFVLATGSGGASVVAVSLLDRSVRSAAQLAQLVGDTPLAAIPIIASARDRRRRRLILLAVAVAVVALLVGAGWWVDRNVVPLDVLMFELQRQLGGWVATGAPASVG